MCPHVWPIKLILITSLTKVETANNIERRSNQWRSFTSRLHQSETWIFKSTLISIETLLKLLPVSMSKISYRCYLSFSSAFLNCKILIRWNIYANTDISVIILASILAPPIVLLYIFIYSSTNGNKRVVVVWKEIHPKIVWFDFMFLFMFIYIQYVFMTQLWFWFYHL